MPVAHPNYSGLLIYDWNKGEAPRPGAFAINKAGKGLTHLANKAYGAAAMYRLINRNDWNRTNLTYRQSSTSCKSKEVDPQGAFQDNAFIALCQADRPEWARKLGFRYAPIWIPSPDMPQPAGTNTPKRPSVSPMISPALLKTPILLGDRKQTVPLNPASAAALQFAGRGTTVKVDPMSPSQQQAAMQLASTVPSDTKVLWVGVGLAALAIAALMAMTPTSKR